MQFYSIKNIILFESVPDLSDNTKAVFDEMIRCGLNREYKMYWKVSSDREFERYENVTYINTQTSQGRKLWKKLEWQAKALICCNGFLCPTRKKQVSFYLSHGTPIKSVKNYYTVPPKIQYSFSAGEGVKEIYAYELNVNESKVLCLGYPRNDALTNYKGDIKRFLETTCDKIIVWYPTFRQHKSGKSFTKSSSLPILHDTEKAILLNECARKNNALIVLKPHFAQDISYIQDLGLSNIRFIDDSFFVKNNVTSYEFVGSCDALITDYSSIYYDFTLCDKPIALVWEDIEEYKQSPGLIDDYEFWAKGAEKIYTLDELEKFVCNVAKDIDLLKRERNEIKALSNYSADGKNAERVVDFILENIQCCNKEQN